MSGRRIGRRALHGALVLVAALAAFLTAASGASAFIVRGSAEQVDVTRLSANAEASLLGPGGSVVATQGADPLGGLLFRNVTPGAGYRVHVIATGETSTAVTVHSPAAKPWDPAVYAQPIREGGYGYLTTRDGTRLAIDVHLPGGPGPYPTLIEYSGYGYANPAGPENGLAQVANLMGFAVVDVNMRGTGCSGGAFDYFEALQNLDGYDVIETIARQPWVLANKVGMFGISYGGISQLFTAQTRPSRLEAIAPLSVVDATSTTLYPGGILNTGFALPWAEQRQQNAEPAGPGAGEAWAYEQILKGDTTCAANQALHGEATNLPAKIKANSTYNAAVADPLDPVTFVKQINVPTFLACQWQDEQTGGHCADLAQHFAAKTPKWFTFSNGVHGDSLDPATFTRLFDFLELYVAHQPPIVRAAVVRGLAPLIYRAALGLPATDLVTLPPDPIQAQPTYEAALAAFQALPPIRVLFDNGAGTSPTGITTAGDPYPGFDASFSKFPISGTKARTWYLEPGGALGEKPPVGEGVDTYTSDPNALPLTDFGPNTGPGGLWGNASQWDWKWEQSPAGSTVSYVSSPLATDTAAIGGGSVRLWVRSSTPDVDLQATVSEVRPDGNETFVQNGWIRASERKLATSGENMFKQRPTVLQPIPTFLASDVEPMPANEFVPVTIPLYFEGHAYRAGSRIRVTVAAPNGTQPVWSFSQTQPEGTTATESVAFSPTMPSSIVLPVVPGVAVPTALPACPSLRNEPCRAYQAYVNDGS
jgi:predicted acyl esterase